MIRRSMTPWMRSSAPARRVWKPLNKSPGAGKESNWVPAPKDEFSLYIRAYWPKAAILDGTWQPPAVHRIGS